MQRIVTLIRSLYTPLQIPKQTNFVSSIKDVCGSNLLSPWTPMISSICNFKVKGRVRRRCKSCYFVVRDERMYVICPKFPRHKQMAMKPKPHNTWILTHASQSRVRPW
ncbi:large ribosomal subunit protein bL36m [Amyelois transitella]|uniref:large ribosomal subunit protein bL36m n=1 Tax=Amyelois transitella TaxID=680683 RepID=UPI00067D8ED3|nr:large ribosomal subunit protein bL36m [Amyelois transitella]XP_060802460.1 large ribosomal subunit protein bL36m [Amyelois transitella]